MSEFYGTAYSNKCKPKIEVVSVKIYVERERERVKQLRDKDDPGWWKDKSRSTWARAQFGETLVEKDGLTHAGGEPVQYLCDVCHKVMGHKYGKFFLVDFDEDDHYEGYAVDICRRCMKAFLRKLFPAAKEVLI